MPRWTTAPLHVTFAGLLLGTVPVQTLAAQSLGQRLERVLDREPLTRHFWGVAVTDQAGRLLYQRNADRLFTPASNAKLVVAAAAAVLLPPDWAAVTSVYATGPVTNGVLQGHLILYGRGDPTMGRRCYGADTTAPDVCATDPFRPLVELARQVRAHGVRLVAGDVVGDGSWFDGELLHPAWEHADLAWWYAAPVSGLGFADNSYTLMASPTVEDAPAALTVTPELGALVIENRTRTVAAGTPRSLDITREALGGGVTRLVVRGDVPVGTAPRPEYVAVDDPSRYAALAFRRALADEGISVLGGTWATTDSLLFRGAREGPALASVTSRPVADWLFPILNVSQNWFADMLFKQLGRQHGGAGTWAAGRDVVRRFLRDSVGVDSTHFRLTDGSGLAATNLVTPAALVRLLAWMRGHPSFDTFARGMPVAGRPGSLRNRFTGTPLEGRVVAKTGTITGVNALSGWLERPRGGPLLFAIVANHHTLGNAMVPAIDAVVRALYSPP